MTLSQFRAKWGYDALALRLLIDKIFNEPRDTTLQMVIAAREGLDDLGKALRNPLD